MGFIIIVIMVAVFITMGLLIKMNRSKKFNDFCDDLDKGKYKEETPTKVMDNISKEEKGLGEKAEQNTKKAEKLGKESNTINQYLGGRGVGPEKGGSK